MRMVPLSSCPEMELITSLSLPPSIHSLAAIDNDATGGVDNAAQVQAKADNWCASQFSNGIAAQTSTCFGTLVRNAAPTLRAFRMLHVWVCALPMPTHTDAPQPYVFPPTI